MIALSIRDLPRLRHHVAVPSAVRTSGPQKILHFGVGAFHRAHQAAYLDQLHQSGDNEWSLTGVGVRPEDTRIRDVLHQQDNLYTLMTVAPDGTTEARVVGAIDRYIHAPDHPAEVLDAISAPETSVLSLTITEGGYGVDTRTGAFSAPSSDMLTDMRGITFDAKGLPSTDPVSTIGYIVAGLARRRARGVPGLTVLSCDNIQNNGGVARTSVVGCAAAIDPSLATWIENEVSFPSSMVDRITPVTTDATRELAGDGWCVDDLWPVRSEAFSQWIIEDDFAAGRPALDSVGVQLVSDVAPYEKMKLRLLNASHQLLGHVGLAAGFTMVHEACQDPRVSRYVEHYMRHEASPTLDPVPGIDLDNYISALLERFASEALQDTLARQVVESADRIALFALPVVRDRLASNESIGCSALAVAAWRYRVDKDDPTDADPTAFLRTTAGFEDLAEDETFTAAFLDAYRCLQRAGVTTAMSVALGD